MKNSSDFFDLNSYPLNVFSQKEFYDNGQGPNPPHDHEPINKRPPNSHQLNVPYSANTITGHTLTSAPPPTQTNYLNEMVPSQDNYSPPNPMNLHNTEKEYRKIIKEREQWQNEDYSRMFKEKLLCDLFNSTIQPLTNATKDLPEFPLNTLAHKPRRFIEDICHKHNLPSALVGSVAIGIASVACRGKFIVKRNNDHFEQVTLFILPLAESGTGKTPLFKIMYQPIYQHEKLERERVAQRSPDSPPPIYCIFKTTPQALEKIMHEQEGIIGIVGSEAGPLKSITHKNDDLLLMGYDGEPYRSLKVKGSQVIQQPCVSICLIAQPQSVEKFFQNKELQEDGLIGRFLIAQTKPSPHTSPPEELDPMLKNDWTTIIHNILNIMRYNEPHQLELTEGAHQAWKFFAQQTLAKSQTQEASTVEKSFYRKLAGTTLRLAGLLHLLAGQSYHDDISVPTMENAIQLATFFEAHTVDALCSAEDKTISLAQKASKFLSEKRETQIPVREIYRHLHIKRHELEPALQKLEEHNHIAVIKEGRHETCLIHPSLAFFLHQSQ